MKKNKKKNSVKEIFLTDEQLKKALDRANENSKNWIIWPKSVARKECPSEDFDPIN